MWLGSIMFEDVRNLRGEIMIPQIVWIKLDCMNRCYHVSAGVC